MVALWVVRFPAPEKVLRRGDSASRPGAIRDTIGPMTLIVFDLDGTLLNADSVVSEFTRETLKLLTRSGVAYTVATGRTRHSSQQVLQGHGFDLPHIYKNGVVIWHPNSASFSHRNVLTVEEINAVRLACVEQGVTPFVFTLDGDGQHAVHHGPLKSDAEHALQRMYLQGRGLSAHPIESLPGDVDVTNVSAIGGQPAIEAIAKFVGGQDHLVAYSGPGFEDQGLYWIDIHHTLASKGNAVQVVREMLGFDSVICFGDSDNDLSLFSVANESYAPANALAEVKSAATDVIGHHDEDGIAHFLRQRFAL